MSLPRQRLTWSSDQLRSVRATLACKRCLSLVGLNGTTVGPYKQAIDNLYNCTDCLRELLAAGYAKATRLEPR